MTQTKLLEHNGIMASESLQMDVIADFFLMLLGSAAALSFEDPTPAPVAHSSDSAVLAVVVVVVLVCVALAAVISVLLYRKKHHRVHQIGIGKVHFKRLSPVSSPLQYTSYKLYVDLCIIIPKLKLVLILLTST